MYDLSSLLTYIISFHQFGRHMWIDLAVVRINSYKSNVFQSKFLNCLARPHPSLDQAAPYFSPTFHASNFSVVVELYAVAMVEDLYPILRK
jgi:hypothetical protein